MLRKFHSIQSVLIILVVIFSLSSCSKDSDPPLFQPANFMLGDWYQPDNPVYVRFSFTKNNIVEENRNNANPYIQLIDYRERYDNDEFIVSIESNRVDDIDTYKFTISRNDGSPIDEFTGQKTLTRSFQRAIVNGREALLLDWPGQNGGVLFRE